MATYFVSRHPAAIEWALAEGLDVDHRVEHLDPDALDPGDVVIGTLPVNLAERVCKRGARYLHLSLEVPAGRRGVELTAAEMRRYGARIEEYRVTRA